MTLSISACFCGGLSYIHPYYVPDDVYKDIEMFTEEVSERLSRANN